MPAYTPITVAVDAMGGDNAPEVVIAGARALLESAVPADVALQLVLVGSEAPLAALKHDYGARVTVVPTTEVIGMSEHPAQAIKRKKDSSIVVGCRLVKEGTAQAFFSAGSTGAAMAAATLIIGRIAGVKRPAIATVIPAPKGQVVMLDAGANTDVDASMIQQFASMGAVYAHELLGVAAPRVGLLNVGTEETKGSALVQEGYRLLQENVLAGNARFAGNAEGSDLFSGRFDVIAADGFTGNIVLKAMEGTVAALFGELKGIFYKNIPNKLAAGVIQKDLLALKNQLDIEVIGGAPLLGLKAPVVIAHGSSSALAIANGIRATAAAVQQQVPQLIAAAVQGKTPGAVQDA